MDRPVEATLARRELERLASDPAWRILLEIWRRGSRGLPPASLRDLVVATDQSSTSVVRWHLIRLRDEGLVDWEPGLSRTLRLTDAGHWAVHRAVAGAEAQ